MNPRSPFIMTAYFSFSSFFYNFHTPVYERKCKIHIVFHLSPEKLLTTLLMKTKTLDLNCQLNWSTMKNNRPNNLLNHKLWPVLLWIKTSDQSLILFWRCFETPHSLCSNPFPWEIKERNTVLFNFIIYKISVYVSVLRNGSSIMSFNTDILQCIAFRLI